jgi:streptogramin lyase
MNVHARARASAQAIDRSATRLDPVAGLDDLLRRQRRQPVQRAIGAGAVWAALHGEDEVQRYDPATGELLDRYPVPDPTALAVDGQTVWVPAAMDGCAASMSTPARFGCVPPPSW